MSVDKVETSLAISELGADDRRLVVAIGANGLVSLSVVSGPDYVEANVVADPGDLRDFMGAISDDEGEYWSLCENGGSLSFKKSSGRIILFAHQGHAGFPATDPPDEMGDRFVVDAQVLSARIVFEESKLKSFADLLDDRLEPWVPD
jgi:hypothetical protein